LLTVTKICEDGNFPPGVFYWLWLPGPICTQGVSKEN